jgi:hypothetical protein
VLVRLDEVESRLGFRPLVPDDLAPPLRMSDPVWAIDYGTTADGSTWGQVTIVLAPPGGGGGIHMIQSSGGLGATGASGGATERLGPFEVTLTLPGGDPERLSARFHFRDVSVMAIAILGPELSADDFRAVLASLRPL